ncbi:MAG: hypothetical protein ABH834_07540 [Candidatus Altiarchaeota archaeon]
MTEKCSVCGKKFGGFLGFGGVKKSERDGVCEACREDQLDAKTVKKAKRKKDKLKKAWLYGKR